MGLENYEFTSEFMLERIARLEVKRLAKAVLTVLETRGIAVPEEDAARIRACTDEARVDAWLRRAATATRLDEVLRDDA